MFADVLVQKPNICVSWIIGGGWDLIKKNQEKIFGIPYDMISIV